jgi:hypothetical protein
VLPKELMQDKIEKRSRRAPAGRKSSNEGIRLIVGVQDWSSCDPAGACAIRSTQLMYRFAGSKAAEREAMIACALSELFIFVPCERV